MTIRRAKKSDIPDVLKLLSQVLEIHAAIRPDLFRSGTTKYSSDELEEIFADDNRPVYVACDDRETLLGYAFCEYLPPSDSANMVPVSSLYLDDLCVDEAGRRMHVGQALFAHVKEEARRLGCHDINLNVWEGNDSARRFYEKMGMKVKKTTMEFLL